MAALPILTQQTTISIANSTGTPVIINGVTGITGIGSGKATEIDVTTLASTAAEFVQGLRDEGEYKIDLIRNQDDLGQLEMFNALGLQASRQFVVTMPTSAANIITHTGFVKSITTDIAKDGAVKGEANIRITGPIVFS